MPSDIKEAIGSRTQITWTLDSLASSATAGRESTAVDNSSNLFDDALVTIVLPYPNSAPANSKGIFIFAYGYDGTTYDGYATGSDAAYTFDDITANGQNLKQLGFITAIQNKTLRATFAVASAFGGVLPRGWGLVALNHSGQTLSTSCTAYYRGKYGTVG